MSQFFNAFKKFKAMLKKSSGQNNVFGNDPRGAYDSKVFHVVCYKQSIGIQTSVYTHHNKMSKKYWRTKSLIEMPK